MFDAEYQLEPEDEFLGSDLGFLDADGLAGAMSGHVRGEVPIDVMEIVAAIDVQRGVLPYVVCGFAPGFRGYVLDYGTWPEQSRWWSTRSLSRTIQEELPGMSNEAALFESLKHLTSKLMKQGWMRQGQRLNIGLGLIDASWGPSTDTVFKFAREYGGGVWIPAYGQAVTASQKDLHEDKPKPREQTGPYWRRRFDSHRVHDYFRIDSNFWKTKVQQCFAAPENEDGSLRLFLGEHQQYADHLTSEYPVETEARTIKAKRVVEWKLRPDRENHWLDCTYFCCAAASVQRIILPGTEDFYTGLRRRKPKIVTQSELDGRFI
jgi:hypothetical protein